MNKNSKKPYFLKSFYKEAVIPILIALFVIQFAVQAFKIPTASMEKSLLVGDFLLGLKFVYGIDLPWIEKRVLKFTDPEKGDVVIFSYPGDPRYPEYDSDRYSFLANLFLFGNLYWDSQENDLIWYAPKDYIKRCVATSGDNIRLSRKKLWINDSLTTIPNQGYYSDFNSQVTDLARDSLNFTLPIPNQNFQLDTLSYAHLSWIRSLAIQEHPNKTIELVMDIYINGELANATNFNQNLVSLPTLHKYIRTGFIKINESPAFFGKRHQYDYFTGIELEKAMQHIQNFYGIRNQTLSFKPYLKIDDLKQTNYTVLYPVYFMMGDNRDNSLDSRYFGLVSDLNIKAKAFITYFSLENDSKVSLLNPFSWIHLPFDLRWNRIAKLIN